MAKVLWNIRKKTWQSMSCSESFSKNIHNGQLCISWFRICQIISSKAAGLLKCSCIYFRIYIYIFIFLCRFSRNVCVSCHCFLSLDVMSKNVWNNMLFENSHGHYISDRHKFIIINICVKFKANYTHLKSLSTFV